MTVPISADTVAGTVSDSMPDRVRTVLRAPSGRTALLATMFVFGEGAGPGEAGPLLYYRELPG